MHVEDSPYTHTTIEEPSLYSQHAHNTLYGPMVYPLGRTPEQCVAQGQAGHPRTNTVTGKMDWSALNSE